MIQTELTRTEIDMARNLWHALMIDHNLDRETWKAVPEDVRAAVLTAVGAGYSGAVVSDKYPRARNPFDVSAK